MSASAGNSRRATSADAVALFALFAAALAVGGPPAHAQGKLLGAQDCEKCHKAQIKKWRVEEPAQLGAKAHFNTNKQLSDPKAAKFAASIGLASPLDPGGRCAACHATVVRGTLRTGVSCESCHGAASLWNPVHDKEPLAESYKKSIPLGLRDLHQKPPAIAQTCVTCHVTPEKALAQAGHPSGATFDAGASLRKLVHWTSAFTGDGSEHASYDYAQVGALARPLVQRVLASGGGAKPAPGLTATSAGTLATRPAGTAATTPTAPAGGGIAATRPTTPAKAVAPAAPPAPWDWDRPVAPLPEDYPSDEPAAPPASEPPPGPGVTPEEPGAPVAPARPAAPRPVALRTERSIVVDQPALPVAEVAPAPTPYPLGPPERNAAADAAARRGRGAELLAKLLAAGKRVPDLPAPDKPREFRGPDSELLNVQDIALYLALETLRKPQ